MTWLIACERSGRVRDAMLARGIDAVSCDLCPTRAPGPHIQGDVEPLLRKRWSGIIAHPDCTYLTNAGAKHLYIGKRRWNDDETENPMDPQRVWSCVEAARFFKQCLNGNAPKRAVENPIMHALAFALVGARATQFVQPWWFGEPMFKATGFHLIGLPKLRATNMLTPPALGSEEHKQWSWVFRMAPSEDRAEKRSVTARGIADAIAEQWASDADVSVAA
ncbi:MAG: hypothetical protein AAGK79_17340 [Pseudomonadota bacterium]